MGAGIMGVVTPGLAARLLNGTGHVNLGLGIIMTLQGIGASCSASYGGLAAHLLGYGPAFLALAAAPKRGIHPLLPQAAGGAIQPSFTRACTARIMHDKEVPP